MVRDITPASRPDAISRFEVSLHSLVQALYWSLIVIIEDNVEKGRACAASDARKVHGWRRYVGSRAVKMSSEGIQVGAVTKKSEAGYIDCLKSLPSSNFLFLFFANGFFFLFPFSSSCALNPVRDELTATGGVWGIANWFWWLKSIN